MTNEQWSPIATKVAGVRDPRRRIVRRPWGLLLHTTGGGVTDLAVWSRKTVRGKVVRTRRKTPLVPRDVALDLYIKSQNGSNGYLWGGPHYVIDHDGGLYQLAPDDALLSHCGGDDRAIYRSGRWIKAATAEMTARWFAQWGPRFDDPYDLFPSKSPNADYIGVEMIPIGDGFGGEPMAPGLRFTRAQHEAAIRLVADVGARHFLPHGWTQTSRLLGHEDVQPLERDDSGGGWDPGFLRPRPYFDFAYVRARGA